MVGDEWELYGLDRNPDWLELAPRKGIFRTQFHFLDLNVPNEDWKEVFDVSTCFETFEHVGKYRVAVRNVCSSVKPGGFALLSVPNEVGIPGVVKFLGRRVLRGERYEQVLEGKSQWAYLRALLNGGDIERFRQPPREIWGPHLGFDIRQFESFLAREMADEFGLRLVRRRRVALGFGRLYLLRRA